MKIAGLQKVTLVDYPGEVACTIFLFGCNFRCGFCYNPALVIGASLGDALDGQCSGKAMGGTDSFSEEYVLDFLKKRVGKLDAVCITGGEPLMSLDFDFVRKIRDLGFKVKIDTSGSFPSKLKEVIDLGLVDYIAMDVKSCKEDYSRVAAVDVDVSKIEESMRIVNDFDRRFGGSEVRGFGCGEFRTTIVGRLHSKDCVIGMAKWVNDVCGVKPERFFLQGFKAKGNFIDSSLTTSALPKA